MITAIELENFRGFGKRQRIELSPITLLYGTNSAGKTALLHSLLFLHEVLVEKNESPDRSTLGGKFTNFGSFRELVFKGNLDSKIRIKVEMSFDWEYGGHDWNYNYADMGDLEPQGPVNEVAVEIGFNSQEEKFRICEYTFFAGNQPIVRIDFGDADIVRDLIDLESFYGLTDATMSLFGNNCVCPSDFIKDDVLSIPIHCNGKIIDGQNFFKASSVSSPSRKGQDRVEDSTARFFAAWIRGISHQLLHHLSEITSLGPLREVPIGFVPRRHIDKGRIANGLSAWDRLSMISPQNLKHVNKWLGPEGMDLGYRLESVVYVPLESELRGLMNNKSTEISVVPRWDLIQDPGTGRIPSEIPGQIFLVPLRDATHPMEGPDLWQRPSSVGVGISQVIPVIYHSVVGVPNRLLAKKIVMIEQPELHLHPRAQTRLGDMFLHSFGKNIEYQSKPISDQQLVLETHSEHLLLRILRRIRESSCGELPKDLSSVEPDIISVYYFERSSEGIVATKLRIDETGEFIDRWPNGFFEDRAEELF